MCINTLLIDIFYYIIQLSSFDNIIKMNFSWQQTKALVIKNLLVKKASKIGTLIDILVPTFLCYSYITKFHQGEILSKQNIL